MEMTPEALVQSCKNNNGYRQPHLNDQLFLQCKGYFEIKHLEPYTTLKVLWLDQNAITKIEGVETLKTLASIFLQNNNIRVMKGLNGLANLRAINLSNNYITKIECLSGCPLLETLELTHNRIESLSNMEELWGAKHLSCLDVSHNMLVADDDGADGMVLVKFFSKMPEIAVLYLHGQELTRRLKFYRKNMVANIKNLTYLDERPIFPEERRATEAWAVGGAEAEKEVLEDIRREKNEHLSSCVQVMADLKEKNKETKAKAEAEWAVRQEERKEAAALNRVAWRGAFTALDHEEFAGRGELEAVEEAAALAAAEQVRASAAECSARAKARVAAEADAESRRQVEAEAAAEIEREEADMAKEMAAQKAAKQADFDEMRYWVRKFQEDDAAVEQEMIDNFDAVLGELLPGQRNVPEGRALIEEGVAEEDEVAAARKVVLRAAEGEGEEAPAVAVASNKDAAEGDKKPLRKGKKPRRKWDAGGGLWEQFYAADASAKAKHIDASAM